MELNQFKQNRCLFSSRSQYLNVDKTISNSSMVYIMQQTNFWKEKEKLCVKKTIFSSSSLYELFASLWVRDLRLCLDGWFGWLDSWFVPTGVYKVPFNLIFFPNSVFQILIFSPKISVPLSLFTAWYSSQQPRYHRAYDINPFFFTLYSSHDITYLSSQLDILPQQTW